MDAVRFACTLDTECIGGARAQIGHVNHLPTNSGKISGILTRVNVLIIFFIQVQRQDIIVQMPCALTNGLEILRPLHLESGWPWNAELPILAGGVGIMAAMWTIFAFLALSFQ